MGKKKRAEAGLEEEEAFPRGGGSGLAPIEKKKLQQVPGCNEYAINSVQQACRVCMPSSPCSLAVTLCACYCATIEGLSMMYHLTCRPIPPPGCSPAAASAATVSGCAPRLVS
jgi:hypothetical protein